MECEHLDGNIMGKCAICGDLVCGECFEEIFNTMICSNHEELNDEGEWELVGLYTADHNIEESRYFLDEQGVTSILVETDDDTIELYVPSDEKPDAFAALGGENDDLLECQGCQVQYSREVGVCPICGVSAAAQTENE